MRNRAKCKACGDVLESFLRNDYITCKCGQVSIYGGEWVFGTEAIDYSNFLRIDETGREIPVTYIEKQTVQEEKKEDSKPEPELRREVFIHELDRMIQSFEELPEHAKRSSVSHYDLISLMLLVSNILKRE